MVDQRIQPIGYRMTDIGYTIFQATNLLESSLILIFRIYLGRKQDGPQIKLQNA